MAESVLLLENIATAVLVGPDQLASLHRLLLEAAAVLGMEPPDLYVRQVHTCPTPLSSTALLARYHCASAGTIVPYRSRSKCMVLKGCVIGHVMLP